MSELKSLIIKNDLMLPKDQVDRLVTMDTQKALYALSSDKESGPFLLYCCGDDLQTISAKTNIPGDVILATAIQYRWPEKARILNRDPLTTPKDLQKNLVNTILVATIVSVQKDLGDVIAGRKSPDDCPLIPKSHGALEKLMNMISSLNSQGDAPAPTGQTVVHAANVQINQGVVMDKTTRSELLKKIGEEG